MLKRLRDAQADNDFIYGVILGSGINQDGKTNGITAPSVSSQIELERAIYTRYRINPESISYVEAHGTGTKLGDPIELEALATVFKEGTARKNFCALGSVKTNIGHATAAAGVAGAQKVLLSMRNRTLVPSLNVTRENSRFDFKNSPFYISRETQAWDVAPGSRRRAAVSSFGFSGTNAHLVIEEYSYPDGGTVPPGTAPRSSCRFRPEQRSSCDRNPVICWNSFAQLNSRSIWLPSPTRCRSVERRWRSGWALWSARSISWRRSSARISAA